MNVSVRFPDSVTDRGPGIRLPHAAEAFPPHIPKNGNLEVSRSGAIRPDRTTIVQNREAWGLACARLQPLGLDSFASPCSPARPTPPISRGLMPKRPPSPLPRMIGPDFTSVSTG